MYKKRLTKQIKVGDILIGGNESIVIQSMTNTKTEDTKNTLKQIHDLAKAGAKIVRVAIPDKKAVTGFAEIVTKTKTPLVADIHYDYKLAIAAIEAGAAKIRINPGNIGDKKQVLLILKKAKSAAVPIRIGINTGSLKKQKNKKNQDNHVKIALENAREYIDFFKDNKFEQLIFSLKTSNVRGMIYLNELFSKEFDYPLHLGVTEAGTGKSGVIKSSIGIGTLLYQGIGDTIRVSLTGDPVKEIYTAKQILSSLNLLQSSVNIIACPTCGRTDLDVENLALKIEKKLKDINKPLKIAVMGCSVNGIGEAGDADFGICGSKKQGIIFAKGKIIKKVAHENLLSDFLTLLLSEISENH